MGTDEYSDKIDVFRSGLDDFAPPELELTESGRGVVCCGGPKKSSRPRRESPGFEDFGGAGSAFEGIVFRGAPGGAIVGLLGSSISNRFTSGFFGGGAETEAGADATEAFRVSNFCFTTFRG